MKKKNLFMVLFVLATAMFYSCGSDDSSNNNGNNDDNPTTDDNTPGVPHMMEGIWKAETFSYMVLEDTYTFDFTMIKGGCATDYLTISAAGVASLTENNKNEENDCVDIVKTGSWTEQTVTISGGAREVVSYNETTLKLKYPYNWGGQQADITVEYSRQ